MTAAPREGRAAESVRGERSVALVNMARSVTEQLLKFGSVKRGLLGVSTVALRSE